jgi:signal transduction histidine kinase
MGLEHKLQQVFLNLFLNAKDAMPKGGWLSVATRLDGGRAVVEVADTGSGIPSEYLARIYDPFFTTKTTGHGTGLGLSISYGIVREHHGSIDCESVVGQGTRFVLRFPPAAVEEPARSVVGSRSDPTRAPHRAGVPGGDPASQRRPSGPPAGRTPKAAHS